MFDQDVVSRRFRLPSTKLVEVRRVMSEEPHEVVVREVNEDNQLSCHEFTLALAFLLKYATPVRNL